MKKLLLLILLLMLNNLFSQDLLMDIDNAFIPVKEFKFELKLESYKDDTKKKTEVYTTYSYPPNQCILVGKEPAIIAGNTTLRINDTIYNYTKKIDKMSQYSAKVAFNGSLFTQEDILNSMFSNFYTVESSVISEYMNKEALKVTLVGKNKKVAYKTLVFYVDPVSYVPFAREYYSYSGKLIKRMTIDEIEYDSGNLKYLKLTMYDLIRTGLKETMEFNNIVYETVPQKYFTKSYMKILAR